MVKVNNSKIKRDISDKKMNELVVDIAWDEDYAGIDITTGQKLQNNLRAVRIPRRLWTRAIDKLVNAGIIVKSPNWRLDLESFDEIRSRARDFVTLNKIGETRFGKWINGLRDFALDEGPGHWMPLPMEDIQRYSEENGYAKDASAFVIAARRSKFLRRIVGEDGLLVADDFIYKKTHRSAAFPRKNISKKGK